MTSFTHLRYRRHEAFGAELVPAHTVVIGVTAYQIYGPPDNQRDRF